MRDVTIEDAVQLLEIYAPLVEQTACSFELVPPSVEELSSRIEKYSKSHAWLVAEDAGQVVGYAYATPHRAREAYERSVETSVYVDAEHRGEGVGRELYARLFERLDTIGFHMAFAGIALPNDASVALHKVVGFKPIGIFHQVGFKFGSWHDVSWWQRALR